MPPTVEKISDIHYLIQNFWGSPIVTTVTGDPAAANVWVTTLRNLANLHTSRVVGIQINGAPHSALCGEHEQAVVLQLCFKDMCLIYKLSSTPALFPESLRGLLVDRTFHFVGINVYNKSSRLLNATGELILNKSDLQQVAAQTFGRPDLLFADLRKLAHAVLGKKTATVPARIIRSRWDAETLEEDQVLYASLDVFVTKEIGEALAG